MHYCLDLKHLPYRLTFALLLSAIFGLAVSSVSAQGPTPSFVEEPKAESRSEDEKRILIVYLSRTKNTEAVAEIINHEVGSNMVELTLQTPYPENYGAIVAQVDRENETGYLPPLKTRIENFQDYDIVFLGFPTWDMQLPPPMKSFLHAYDFSGKILIPFNTNGGYGVGSSFDDVKELAPDAQILKGISIKGGLEKEGVLLAIERERREEVRAQVTEWLSNIQMLASD
jgi:flavodoxin